ncbi:hypothetical protein AB7Y49_04500 [Providencia vermicola]|uniref:Uncharacterized protein n=1 Tax=Providencia vermicola TaxID=333965 RepID=A0AAX3RX94_9GAMM|nr:MULTISPECIES: hypothetical protein [Providencia]ELR5141720.1 hypothetical protein [Providencia stuartii]ELX8378220.1 hypothetical protein [Providencia stuartii]ELZ5939201.1 hypothetical protein [Providencia stuartii]EMD5259036.1 hypothetical protein [Providencia stuartii]MCK1144851.1 hypothetical protein [Providencia stuartii]
MIELIAFVSFIKALVVGVISFSSAIAKAAERLDEKTGLRIFAGGCLMMLELLIENKKGKA